MNIEEKYRKLEQILRDMNKVVVAYSGGVDSSFLLKVACNVLKENSMGVMAISPSFPSREYEKAISFAKNIGAKLEIIETDELDDTNYTSNPVNRCYFCKNELFNKITSLAGTRGYENLVDGSNQDDLNDHRPGKKALEEKKVRSPLQEAGLTKSDIRHLSQSLGLSTWNKEELACLSSRFPYGEKIDASKLKMVDQAETFLISEGFHNVRARHIKNTIKIEVDPKDISLFLEPVKRERIVKKLKEIGYLYVTLDLEGYRRGSLNKVLSSVKMDKY